MRFTQLASGFCLLSMSLQAQIALLTAYDHAPSASTSAAMAAELSGLFQSTGVEITLRPEAPWVYLGSPRHVLYVSFHGNCEYAHRVLSAPRGRVLAKLATVNGEVQPLMSVDCDAVARTMAPYMSGAELRQSSRVFGRALARVVAHEVFHWVAHQVTHRHSELFSEAMSGRTLLADHASFDAEETKLLRVSR